MATKIGHLMARRQGTTGGPATGTGDPTVLGPTAQPDPAPLTLEGLDRGIRELRRTRA